MMNLLPAQAALRQLITSTTCIALLSGLSAAQLPNPAYGWNLGNTMEPPSGVGTWGGSPSKLLIYSVASNGFNAVRIPCAWDSHADHASHKIDPVYLAQVKQVVDWCYNRHLYVMVNDHWDGGWLENHLTGTVNPVLNEKMKAYWGQIAKAFGDYDDHLLFAAANEPNVDRQPQMAELSVYYQTFVNAVRSQGQKNLNRWLVLQGPSTATDKTYNWMNSLPRDTAKGRLMVEVHCYTPYQFTLMDTDQSWGKMFFYWGKGYHSTTDAARNATWGEEANIDSEFEKMTEKFVRRGVPVILGEYGAYRRSKLTGVNADLNYASTTYWDKYVGDSARRHGLIPFYWATPGGLFDWTTGKVKDRPTITALTGGSPLPPTYSSQ